MCKIMENKCEPQSKQSALSEYIHETQTVLVTPRRMLVWLDFDNFSVSRTTLII